MLITLPFRSVDWLQVFNGQLIMSDRKMHTLYGVDLKTFSKFKIEISSFNVTAVTPWRPSTGSINIF